MIFDQKRNNIKFIRIKKKNLVLSRFNLATKTYKFTKFHKIKNRSLKRNLIFNSSKISNYSTFFIISRKSFYFRDYNFKSIRSFIKKPYNKIFFFCSVPFLPIFKKPNEVRMGKGKGGKFAYNVFPIYPGKTFATVLFKFNFVLTSIKTLKKVNYYLTKLPSKFMIVKKVF